MPEGFSMHVVIPHGSQNSHYGLRMAHKRVVTTPHGKLSGYYNPVDVRHPPPLRGSSPCKAGQFIPVGFDCGHSPIKKQSRL